MLDLCERFHCLPSALFAENEELLWYIQVQNAGRPVAPDVGEV